MIYGGSAGPGLLTELGDTVDGLFLGRFAHDPAALAAVLDEAAALAALRAPSSVRLQQGLETAGNAHRLEAQMKSHGQGSGAGA